MSSRPGNKNKKGSFAKSSRQKKIEETARFNNNGGRKNQNKKEQPHSVLSVSGIPECTDDELIKLLRNRYGKSFAYREITYDGDRAFITLTNSQEANQISKLKEIDFKGKKVKIGVFNGDPSNIITPKKMEYLTEFILKRVNRETRILELSKIKGVEEMKEKGISVDLNNTTFMSSLFRSIKNIYPEVNAIDFSSNEIRELGIFKNMTFYLPKVTTLFFSNNLIKDIKTLEALKELRLLEVSFKGNPISENKDKKDYIKVVSEKLRTIRILDSEPVEPPVSILKMLSTKGSFNWPNDIEGIVVNFLTAYHTIFQENRAQVGEAYTDNAIMTFFITSNEKGRAMISNLFGNFPENRNLHSEKGHPEEKIEDVHLGREAITKFLTELPPMNFIFQSFVSDAVVEKLENDLMFISLHGFLEANEEKISFDRTFLLIPSNTPLGVSIVNDSLNIHPYTGKSIVPIREPRELGLL